jgi:hypothetical protein
MDFPISVRGAIRKTLFLKDVETSSLSSLTTNLVNLTLFVLVVSNQGPLL